MIAEKVKAIITGDIVSSSNYPQKAKGPIFKRIHHLFEGLKGRMEIYRGDSFQGLLEQPEEALDLALRIRLIFRSTKSEGNTMPPDCRLAVGFGTIHHLSDKIMEGDGPAFRNSGPYLDRMKKEDRMVFITPWDEINHELYTENKLAEAIIGRWTYSQAEVIDQAITGMSQVKIAENLRISQPAVNQRLKAASWDAIDVFRQRFRQLVSNRL